MCCGWGGLNDTRSGSNADLGASPYRYDRPLCHQAISGLIRIWHGVCSVLGWDHIDRVMWSAPLCNIMRKKIIVLFIGLKSDTVVHWNLKQGWGNRAGSHYMVAFSSSATVKAQVRNVLITISKFGDRRITS